MENPSKPHVNANSGINVTSLPPRTLLEVLVYGHEKEKNEFAENILKKLEKQINETQHGNLVRIFWYLDAENKSESEIKEILLNNANASYVLFVNSETEVTDDFIDEHLTPLVKLAEIMKFIANTELVKTPIKK